MSKQASGPGTKAGRALWVGGLVAVVVAGVAVWVGFDLDGHRRGPERVAMNVANDAPLAGGAAVAPQVGMAESGAPVVADDAPADELPPSF